MRSDCQQENYRLQLDAPQILCRSMFVVPACFPAVAQFMAPIVPTQADAKKALGRDGMVLHDKHMIAVKPCTDIDFAGTVDVVRTPRLPQARWLFIDLLFFIAQDTVSNSFTVLNSPAVRRRPLPNNATPSLGGPVRPSPPRRFSAHTHALTLVLAPTLSGEICYSGISPAARLV